MLLLLQACCSCVVVVVAGVLLPELVTCLVLLQMQCPTVVQVSRCEPMLHAMLDLLDKFNRLAPGWRREDHEDLSWPGVWAAYDPPHRPQDDAPLIRKADLDNHNRDGGLWVVIHGRVYDVHDFQATAPCGPTELSSHAALQDSVYSRTPADKLLAARPTSSVRTPSCGHGKMD